MEFSLEKQLAIFAKTLHHTCLITETYKDGGKSG